MGSLCFFYPFLKKNSEKKAFFQSDSNNLEKIIPDSINPSCEINDENNFSSLLSSLKEITINIPESRAWNKNLFEAKASPKKNITKKHKKKI